MSANRFEYRITWRRRSWRPTTSDHSRIVQRRATVDRHIANLERLMPDLEWVRVERRPVGRWESQP